MIKIKIWGDIGLQTSNIVETALSNVNKPDEPILIMINSPGGNISDSIAICNMLKAIPNPIITLTLGYCASAAVMIFLCGSSRYISNDISFMIHQPYSILPNVTPNYSDSQKLTSGLKRFLNIYKKYIVTNTSIPKEKLDIAFKEGKDLYLTHKECIKYKIATNLFTTWDNLYKKEKINPDDETILFDVLTEQAEEY